MLNKKGVLAIDELRGILTFMFVAVIFLLIFYACSVNNAKQEYEKLKFSKEDIEATTVLNSFSGTLVGEEKKVSDVIVEAYLSKNYDYLNKLAMEHFGNLKDSTAYRAYDYWILKISDDSITYDSINYNSYPNRYCASGGGSETYITARDENLQLIKLKVNLFITHKCY